MSIEDPDADRLEQMTPATYEDPDDEGADDLAASELPLDADALDVADQHRPVPIDDDPPEG
jgi:hypothetical protein